MAVFDKEFHTFFDIVTKLDLVSKEEQDILSDYFKQLSDNKLYVVLYDRKHDVSHALRVALYTYLLCKKKNVEAKYHDMAMMVAIYHDSGLDRSKPKDTHGIDSANLFEKYNKDKYSPKDLEIIKRLISLHSSTSNELDMNGLHVRSKKAIEQINLVYSIIKDADAIDRNRLDYSFAKCKPRSLRLTEAKALMETADKVLFEYKKKEYVPSKLDDNAKFNYYYKIYVNFAKKYLPVKNEVIEKRLATSTKIESVLGERAKELFRVPSILFYGNDNSFDLLKEKTDKNANMHMICSDSPLQSFFRTVFQNDVEIGMKVNEYFDENGEYVVKYILDEYVPDAIKKTIKDRKITVHVLDGNLFYKTTEDRYNSRDWVSRNYRDIYAMDKFSINVEEFFHTLLENKVLAYSPWNVSKDIPNIVNNIIYKSYIPKLKLNISDADDSLDDLVKKYYPSRSEFVNKFRNDIKNIMFKDGELNDKNYDEKFNEVRKFVLNNFQSLNSQDVYVYNSKKIDEYINSKEEKTEKKDIKLVTKQEEIKVEKTIVKEKKPLLQGYVAMVVLSGLIGIFCGGIMAVLYYLITK